MDNTLFKKRTIAVLESLLESADLDKKTLLNDCLETFAPDEWEPKENLSSPELARFNELTQKGEHGELDATTFIELMALTCDTCKNKTFNHVLSAQALLNELKLESK